LPLGVKLRMGLCNLSRSRHFLAKIFLKFKMSAQVIQGCQMVYFQTKNPNFGKFWRSSDWKLFICFITIRNILRTLGIFYDHLVHFYGFSRFGIMYQEKSGNPEVIHNSSRKRRKRCFDIFGNARV
jgi:hypothetical protein